MWQSRESILGVALMTVVAGCVHAVSAPLGSLAADGYLRAQAGDSAGALAKYQLAWTAQHDDDVALAAAEAACQLGQIDDAFEWLGRLSGHSDVTETMVSVDPDLARARTYQRFNEVLGQLGERQRRYAVDVGAGLPHSTPAAKGIDPEALDRLVRAAEKSDSSALVVLANGKVVGEWYFGGATRRIESMSGTKSMVELAVALLVAEGRIKSLDQPVWSFFAEWKQGRKQAITLRMLLNHTSGLASEPTTTDIYASPDFVQFSLAADLASDPGTQFFYNNKAVNLLAGIVARAAGQEVDAYLRARIFTPLGIRDVTWSHDFSGHAVGMSGMQIHPLDWAKIGQLLLDRGVWHGQQIIPEALIAEATRPSQPFKPTVGLLWWLKYEGAPDSNAQPYGFGAVGALGQYLFVVPGQRLVAVRMVDGSRPPPAEGDFDDFHALVRALKK